MITPIVAKYTGCVCVCSKHAPSYYYNYINLEKSHSLNFLFDTHSTRRELDADSALFFIFSTTHVTNAKLHTSSIYYTPYRPCVAAAF